MTKHEQYFLDMLQTHKDLFDNFKIIHDKYAQAPEKYQDKFNKLGKEVMTIVRRTENQLCSHSEGAKFGKFSSKLADKFWAQVRAYLPKIDFVGTTFD